jgi:hypothetical protein
MMKYCQVEKMEVIELVERSELPARQTLEELGIRVVPFMIGTDVTRRQATMG